MTSGAAQKISNPAEQVNPSTHSGLKAGACSGWTLSGAFVLRPKGRSVGAVEWVKKLVWFYFLLLLAEGILRKWVVPSWSPYLILARDPVVITIYAAAARGRLFPRDTFVGIIFCLLFISLAASIFNGRSNLLVTLYGARAYFLHLPLIFIIPAVFNETDVKKIGGAVLAISAPLAVLAAFQFTAPPNHWLNAAAGGGMDTAVSLYGRVRPSGIFSFTTGMAEFAALASAFAACAAFSENGKTTSFLVPLAALLAIIVFSGSRLLLFMVLIVFAMLVIAVLARPARSARLAGLLITAVVMFWALSLSQPFKSGTNAAHVRMKRAFLEESAGHGGFVDRYVVEYKRLMDTLNDIPPLGYGMGYGTRAASVILGRANEFPLFEQEWPRIIAEFGLLPGLAYIIFLRIGLVLFLFSASVKKLFSGDMLPLLLFGACAPLVGGGNLGVSTTLGFAVFGAGLCLAACRGPSGRAPAPRKK